MRKRSTYRPRPMLVNPVALAIELQQLLSVDDQAKIKAIVAQALDGLRTGSEPAAAWAQLADALNIAEELARAGICCDTDSKHRIAEGQHSLANVFQRHRERNTWTLHAYELEALREAVWLHGVQLQFTTNGDFQRAHHRAAERLRQALTGNAPRDAIVCIGNFRGTRQEPA